MTKVVEILRDFLRLNREFKTKQQAVLWWHEFQRVHFWDKRFSSCYCGKIIQYGIPFIGPVTKGYCDVCYKKMTHEWVDQIMDGMKKACKETWTKKAYRKFWHE